jgi:hypothetical protein
MITHFKGRHLHPRNQQHAIEVWLQRRQLAHVRNRVVLGDRHEVQPAIRRRIER